MAITHSIYLVSDATQAQEFLKKIFGFVVRADEQTITGERFLTMGMGDGSGLQLQITEFDSLAEIVRLKQKSGVVDYIYETNDIGTLISAIEKEGMCIVRQPTHANYGITAIFEDPFGNLWDLIQR